MIIFILKRGVRVEDWAMKDEGYSRVNIAYQITYLQSYD